MDARSESQFEGVTKYITEILVTTHRIPENVNPLAPSASVEIANP
jgi:hypothetical protein